MVTVAQHQDHTICHKTVHFKRLNLLHEFHLYKKGEPVGAATSSRRKTTRCPKRTSVPGALSWRGRGRGQGKEMAELDSLSCFLPRLLLSSYYWCFIIKLSKLNIIKNFLLLRHLLIVFDIISKPTSVYPLFKSLFVFPQSLIQNSNFT